MVSVNLIVYENDFLQVTHKPPDHTAYLLVQVTGSSFFLWVLENYQGMVGVVRELLSQERREEDAPPCQVLTQLSPV